jgi:hypothetical protein
MVEICIGQLNSKHFLNIRNTFTHEFSIPPEGRWTRANGSEERDLPLEEKYSPVFYFLDARNERFFFFEKNRKLVFKIKTRKEKDKTTRPSWDASMDEAKLQNKRSRSQGFRSALKDLRFS